MKKYLLFMLLPFLFLSQSCELFSQAEPLGSIHAIYVGLNYHGTDVRYLEGTLNDATGLDLCFASLSKEHHRPYYSYPLLQKGGDSPSEYDPSSNVSLPTKEKILAQIGSLASVLSENDLTIFSYSGHGIEGGSLVLAPTSFDNPKILDSTNKPKEETLLNVTELLNALSSLPGKKLLLLDSCYCGSFVESSGSSVSLIEKTTYLDEAFNTYFSSTRYSPALFVLAATTADNTSKEPKNTSHIHGYFTNALLEGLGWDHGNRSLKASSPAIKKGALTTDSLYAYILENQKFPLEGLFSFQYQHPTISGGAYTLRLF